MGNKKTIRRGNPLKQSVRDALMARVTRHGKDRVVSELSALDPKLSAASTICKMVRDPSASFSRRNIELLSELAASYERSDSLPQRISRPSPAPARINPPVPAQPQMDPVVQLLTQLAGHFLARVSPQQPIGAYGATPMVDSRVKGFPELGVDLQRKILNSMHKRYAKKRIEEGCCEKEAYRMVWSESYNAYEKATGSNARDVADASNSKILDVIQENHGLVGFWEVARSYWESKGM